MQTDLTFFTNEQGSTLLDRFRKTLKDVKFFDVLVGYFRTSGFYNLHESFESINKVRILVGLNVDRKAFEIIDTHLSQSSLDFESHKRTKEIYSETVTGGRIRFFTQSMELIPILHASDIQKSPKATRVRIQFGSTEYFELIAQNSKALPWLALGQNVQFVLNDTLYDIYE